MDYGYTFQNDGTMIIDNCKLISSSSNTNGRQPVIFNTGTAVITNSTLTAGSYNSSANLRSLVAGVVSSVTDGDGVSLDNTSVYNLNADELVVGTGYTPWENKITEIGDERHSDVKGTYVAGSTAATVYSVDISWGDMEFTYTDASEGQWNPATHSYSGSTPAGWTVNNTDGNKITVTNHSNAAIKADLSFASDSGITAQFVESSTATTPVTSLNIASAAPTGGATVGQAQTDEAYVIITGGTLDASTAAGSVIGTVTVTLDN